MKKSFLLAILALAVIAFAIPVKAAGSDRTITVWLQNLSTGQSIMACPVYAAGPCNTALMFQDSQIASVQLEMMAEGAVSAPLVSLLQSKGWRVVLGSGEIYARDVQSVTIPVPPLATGQFLCVAVIGKLRQTNDTFVGIDNLVVNANTINRWLYTPARDAGTECDDELCVNMPAGTGACSTMGQGFNSNRCPNEKMISYDVGIGGWGNLLEKYNDFNTERPARVLFRINN
ncbi:MAG: spondin domain-containing protein [Patescibacteria group bacterium]